MKDIGVNAIVGMDSSGFNQSVTALRRELYGLAAEMRELTSRSDDFGSSSELTKKKSETLTKQVEAQGKTVSQLKDAYESSLKAKGEDSKETQNLYKQYKTAETYLNNFKKELEETNKEIEFQSTKLGGLSVKLSDFADELNKNFDFEGLEELGGSLTKYVTLPLTAVGAIGTKVAIDFETAFTGVKKTVNATEEEFQGLEKGIRDMSRSIPASAVEIAGVAEAAGQLGIETENILGFTKVMIDLGESTNLTADTAATSFARFSNIMQMPQSEVDRLGSAVVDLGNNFATTEAEIVAMGMRLAGAGKQVKLSESEVMGFATALSSVGIEAEMGGSAFSKLMINIGLAVETGSGDLQDFARVAGMSSGKFRKAFKEDAAGAIVSFVEGLGKIDKSGGSVIRVLDDMEIKEVRLRDTILRAAGASDVFSAAIETGNKAWEENTALTTEAGLRYGTTASQMEVFKNKLVDVGISIGEILIPPLLILLKPLEIMLNVLSAMPKPLQAIIVTIGMFVAAIGPVLLLIGKIPKMISGVSDGISVAQKAFDGIKTVMDGGIPTWAKVTLAVIGVAVALAALGAIIAVIMGRTNDMERAFSSMGSTASAMTGEIGNISMPDMKVPRYARGTSNHRGGFARINEYQDELVMLPKGSSVTPQHQLKPGGDTYNINIVADISKIDEVDKLISLSKNEKRMKRMGKLAWEG